MSNCTIEMTVGSNDLEFDVEFNFTPGQAGYYSGPPENCYPSIPDELEILSIKLGDEDYSNILQLPGIAEKVESLVMEVINDESDY